VCLKKDFSSRTYSDDNGVVQSDGDASTQPLALKHINLIEPVHVDDIL
jgi:hypothetical protein